MINVFLKINNPKEESSEFQYLRVNKDSCWCMGASWSGHLCVYKQSAHCVHACVYGHVYLCFISVQAKGIQDLEP